MKKTLLLTLIFLSLVANSIAQKAESATVENSYKSFLLGTEFQAYPAGQMYGLRGEYFINKKSEINFRVGYNAAFRQDFSGLNDNEQGGGWGFTPGYRYHFANGILRNFFVGARCDFWWLSIDWRDNDNIPINGNTKITVVQPTVDLGYNVRLNKGLNATFSVAFGQEVNVVTKGDAVGQGGISLVGITLTHRIF